MGHHRGADVADPAGLAAAERVLLRELAAVDAACSRFRIDSEISGLHERAGSAVTVSPLLAEALTVALRAAQLTDGVVDPTAARATSVSAVDCPSPLPAIASNSAGSTACTKVRPPAWRTVTLHGSNSPISGSLDRA